MDLLNKSLDETLEIEQCKGECANRRSADNTCSVHDEVFKIMTKRDAVNEAREQAIFARLEDIEEQYQGVLKTQAVLLANQTMILEKLKGIEDQQALQIGLIKGGKFVGYFLGWLISLGIAIVGVWVTVKH